MNDLKNLYIDSKYETIYDLLRRIIYLFGFDSVLMALSQIQEEKEKEYHDYPLYPTFPYHTPPMPETILYNQSPCRNGHIFQWGSSGTTNAEPYEGCPCMCGQVKYHKNNIEIS